MKRFYILIGLMVAVVLIVICARLFSESTSQSVSSGKIVNALPDTRWANGKQEIFFRDTERVDRERLSSINLNGDDKRYLYNNVVYFCFSPEGERIALVTYINAKGGQDVVILDTKSANSEIVENNKRCVEPAWTPNGTRIVYISEQDHGLVIYNVLSKEKKIIKMTANYPTNNHFVITRSGDRIIYYDYVPGPGEYLEGVFQYDISSGEIKNLSGLKKDKPNIFDYVTPDDIYWGNGGGGLNIIHALPISPSSGKVLLNKKDGSLYLDIGGKQEMLVQYDGPIDVKFNRGIENFVCSPDEKFVLFNLYDNIYVADIDTKRVGFLCKGSKPLFYYPVYGPFNEKESITKGYFSFDH